MCNFKILTYNIFHLSIVFIYARDNRSPNIGEAGLKNVAKEFVAEEEPVLRLTLEEWEQNSNAKPNSEDKSSGRTVINIEEEIKYLENHIEIFDTPLKEIGLVMLILCVSFQYVNDPCTK